MGPIENFMFHMRMDSLMFGCALALLHRNAAFQKLAHRILSWRGMLVALCFFFFVSGYLNYKFQGYYMLPFGYTLEAGAITYLLFYFVSKPQSAGGRLLNSRILVHIGLISYSLYLWQELFLTDLPTRWPLGTFPLNLVAAFVAAELSWKLVEQPALKLRRKFEGNRTSSSEPIVEPSTAVAATEVAS